MKLMEKVETLKPSFHAAPEVCNGAVVCNGVPVTTNPTPLTKRLLQPMFRDSPSEGSSEASSHSDDPSFCGITTACTRICDGLPPPKTRAEKRALRRRRPKPSRTVVDLLQAPRRDNREPLPISTIQDIMNRKTEQSSGTFGVNVALSGPVWNLTSPLLLTDYLTFRKRGRALISVATGSFKLQYETIPSLLLQFVLCLCSLFRTCQTFIFVILQIKEMSSQLSIKAFFFCFALMTVTIGLKKLRQPLKWSLYCLHAAH